MTADHEGIPDGGDRLENLLVSEITSEKFNPAPRVTITDCGPI